MDAPYDARRDNYLSDNNFSFAHVSASDIIAISNSNWHNQIGLAGRSKCATMEMLVPVGVPRDG
jgi:hypothetical protein